MFTTKFVGHYFGVLLLFLLLPSGMVFAQSDSKKEPVHEITLFVMPSYVALNWDSPSKLFSTTQNCMLRSILIPDNYMLGHLIVRINTPLLHKPLFLGMVSASETEMIGLVFSHKVGFGILGVVTKGRLETETELKRKLSAYIKRNKLAFITYRLNDKAIRRVLEFVKLFTQKANGKSAPSDYYGDSFWPRYRNEGSGASALGMAMLDVANLLTSESEEWKVQFNIPINLIGGELNHNKKVDNSTIRDTHSWYSGHGKANVDFVPFQLYDPSMMYRWVLDNRARVKSNWKAVSVDGIPGLFVDGRNVPVLVNESILEERPEPNFFIEHSIFKTFNK